MLVTPGRPASPHTRRRSGQSLQENDPIVIKLLKTGGVHLLSRLKRCTISCSYVVERWQKTQHLPSLQFTNKTPLSSEGHVRVQLHDAHSKPPYRPRSGGGPRDSQSNLWIFSGNSKGQGYKILPLLPGSWKPLQNSSGGLF